MVKLCVPLSHRDTSVCVLPTIKAKSFWDRPSSFSRAAILSAMEKENKAGIAKVVLGTKEALVLIRGKDGVMLVNTLYFYDEVMKAPAIKPAKVLEKEVSLAVSLIEEMTEKFKPEAFKDEYNVKLKKAIKSKIAGNEIVVSAEREEPGKVINLMEALKMSLKQGKLKNDA